jgi:predicted TPR repeat methyltransferase
VTDKKPIWDFGCGPGQTTQYLKDLALEISGLDLSGKLIAQANMN